MTKRALPQGWMGKRCRRWLRSAVRAVTRGGVVVEVGSWRGRSTTVLAAHMPPAARLYAVDTWAGVPDDPDQHVELYEGAGDVYADFCRNLAGPIRSERLIPLRMTSLEGAAELGRRLGAHSVDLVFIDADHRYEAVRADIEAFLPLVKPGGVLGGHDYGWPGVRQAVEEMLPGHGTAPTSIWFYRVPG
jgi:predicted O-methyltransferase YrrM